MTSSSDESIEEIRVTPEGWIYLIILAFISVGAVLRNVNLLILMAGMLCAPLIINWRMSVLWLKTLSGTRTLTHHLYAGKLANLQWTCFNHSRLTAWSIEVHDNLRPVAAINDDADTSESTENAAPPHTFFRNLIGRFLGFRTGLLNPENARLNITDIAAGRNITASGRLMFFQRGRYAVGPAVVSTRFPFGLIASRIMLPKVTHFYVAPALGRLTPRWDRRVQSSVTGSDAVKRTRGSEEDEFYALRPWRSGDSRKHVHWRTSAKLGYPIVKQHEQQDNRDFAMLLDLCAMSDPTDKSSSRKSLGESSDHAPSENNASSCETILSFAATVVLRLKTAIHGRIAIGICGNRNTVCISDSHRDLVQQCMRELAIVQPTSSPAIAETLLELHQSVSPSTPIYVISARRKPSLSDLVEFRSQSESETESQSEFPFNQLAHDRLNRIWPSVNWLHVDADEFKEMFEAQPDAERNHIASLTETWMVEDVAC
jgi:hypothetical protein